MPIRVFSDSTQAVLFRRLGCTSYQEVMDREYRVDGFIEYASRYSRARPIFHHGFPSHPSLWSKLRALFLCNL